MNRYAPSKGESKVGSKPAKPSVAAKEIAELSESYIFRIIDWPKHERYSQFGEAIISDKFTICGSEWEMHLFPKGIDDHFGGEEDIQVACHLKNCTSKKVRCKYSFTLLNESSPLKNITWSDPEGVVTFGSQKSGNATWGIDEFFSLQVLDDDRAGYCPDSCLSISVLMEVYGDVDIDSHPLTKAIESAAAQEDLIALANSELTLITRTLPGSKAHLKAGEEFTYQDSLLKQRFHPTTPGSVAYVHKHAP